MDKPLSPIVFVPGKNINNKLFFSFSVFNHIFLNSTINIAFFDPSQYRIIWILRRWTHLYITNNLSIHVEQDF